MAQLTAEERRRIFLSRQGVDRERTRPRPSPITASEPRLTSQRLSPILQITLVAALLSVGWLASHGITVHVPASLAEMVPQR